MKLTLLWLSFLLLLLDAPAPTLGLAFPEDAPDQSETKQLATRDDVLGSEEGFDTLGVSDKVKDFGFALGQFTIAVSDLKVAVNIYTGNDEDIFRLRTVQNELRLVLDQFVRNRKLF